MTPRIAIVGTGIAGLGCAWNLRKAARLSLLEQNSYTGGHTNTVTIDEMGKPLPIDTGFIVFNRVTYPNLCRLFEELGVNAKPAEMSFSVQHIPLGLEYNGMGLNKLFAQRRNILSPRFLALLRKIGRFFKVARELLDSPDPESLTIREFAERYRLGGDFLKLYLVPMSSAIWSTEPGRVLDFPAFTLIHFFHNHGFLGVDAHHTWLTVDGGSQTYVRRMLTELGAPRLGAKVLSVEENSAGVRITGADARVEDFDYAVLACHADQALAMLARPGSDQALLLSPFRYQRNHATLHTDESVMPKVRRAWASWNYRVEETATIHYWMNALQGIPGPRNYFVSLNCDGRIPREKVLYETVYEHPVFTQEAVRAQKELPTLNTQYPGQRIFFCGSYFKYGFHEDAYTSGLNLANVLRERLA